MTSYKMSCPAMSTTSPNQCDILLLLKLYEMRLAQIGKCSSVTVGSYIMLAQWDFWIVCRITSTTPPGGLLLHEVMLAYDWHALFPHASSEHACCAAYRAMFAHVGSGLATARWDVYADKSIKCSLKHPAWNWVCMPCVKGTFPPLCSFFCLIVVSAVNTNCVSACVFCRRAGGEGGGGGGGG